MTYLKFNTVAIRLGKLTVEDIGCGCCSSTDPITKEELLKEIDKELKSLQKLREQILKDEVPVWY